MENLSKTCKILYDKDYLDNMKSINDNNIHKKVYYDNWNEYEDLVNDFKNNLLNVIKNTGMDDWQYFEYFAKPSEYKFGVKFTSSCEYELTNLLKKLTKGQNNLWVEHISKIIDSSIRGLAKSISLIEDEEFQYYFRNKNICNKMVCNMINTILFHTADVEENFELDKIRCFICKKCKNEVDYVDDDFCIECL